MVRAAILVTGDEVLGGRVPERNAAYLARSLAPLGVRVVRTLVVSDTIEDISEGLGQLLALGVDLVCTSGGLGPTYDDLTMAAVAEATSRALTVDETALALVEGRSRAVALRVQVDPADLERMRRKQATLPQGATVLPPIGTAPGCVLTHQGTLIVVLPGPPYELQGMWDVALRDGPIAELVATAKSEPTRTFRLWSIFEAQLVPVLEPLGEEVLDQIGTYTREGELEIVVPPALADAVGELLAEHFGTYLFATDDRHVESLIADALVARGETLAVGESCTGGGLGARLTVLPGASRWFVGGAITYSNESKTVLLGVDRDVIATYGAVSQECVLQMAAGARHVTGADWAVAITGIAGPEGGSADKPVGLVWIGVAGPDDQVVAFEHRLLRSDRETVRRRAQTAALHRLRLALAV